MSSDLHRLGNENAAVVVSSSEANENVNCEDQEARDVDDFEEVTRRIAIAVGTTECQCDRQLQEIDYATQQDNQLPKEHQSVIRVEGCGRYKSRFLFGLIVLVVLLDALT